MAQSGDGSVIDRFVSIQGGNLFAYCGNNPVENADYIGFCFVPVVDKETSSAGSVINTSNTISLSNIKAVLLKPIKALVDKVQEMVNKIKVTYQRGVLSINTGAIAIAIDAISFAISKISHFAVKTGLKILIAWAKNNTVRFLTFVKQYIFDNAINLVVSFLSFLCRKMAISVVWSKFTDKVGDALFGTSTIYKIYNAFSSLGNIIATIFDLLDGKWNDKLAIKIR